jgi:hypothetical protein
MFLNLNIWGLFTPWLVKKTSKKKTFVDVEISYIGCCNFPEQNCVGG